MTNVDEPNFDSAPIWDERLRAEYWALHHRPAIPETVVKAAQGQTDLWGRITSQPYRALSRDEQRLDARYQRIRDEYAAEIVEAYRNR